MFGDSILNIDKVKGAVSRYPKPPGTVYQYGTAGFRMKSELLECVMVRLGLLAVLRSQHLNGQVVGVMVTASHNPEEDNGVKLVEPMGEMLASEWEEYATQVVNAPTIDALMPYLSRLMADLRTDHAVPARIVVARDTRPSGVRLVRALVDGIQALGGHFTDLGEMTTPQLHYFVRCLNTAHMPIPYGEPTEIGYFNKLTDAYVSIVQETNSSVVGANKLLVDGANGIGAPKLLLLIDHLKTRQNNLQISIVNDNIRGKGVLNFKCGADYVKVDQKLPNGVTSDMARGRCCSLDGDADRVVYYYVDNTDKFVLLDGDKIAALAAGFIAEQVQKLPASVKDKIQLGVVQTAYANGASTKYFKNLGIPVACTPTGVKHLHHRAEQFGIGVYFEANGHGTVLFHPDAIRLIREAAGLDPQQAKARQTLLSLVDLINQAVGDAISDMLMVEAILCVRDWALPTWSALYQDLPNRQLKVKVKSRSAFTTTDAERVLVTPEGIQDEINALVNKCEDGRAFVRPSGTEDVVRVYAEAKTQLMCDELAYSVAQLVFDRAGGVGERPVPPSTTK